MVKKRAATRNALESAGPRAGESGLPALPGGLHAMAFRAYGVCIGVRTDDPLLIGQIARLCPPGAAAAEGEATEVEFSLLTSAAPHAGRLYRDAQLLVEHADEAVLLALLEDFIRAEVAYYADDEWTFVHAGVVAKDGRAVVLPGHSHVGKTRLVKALVERGAQYLSDDLAVFDRQARVHPYPVPYGLREGHATLKRLQAVPPDRVAQGPLPAAMVVFTHYRAQTQAWRPRRLSAGRALMSLAGHALAARRMPRQAMAVLAAVLDGALAVQGPRAEAGPVADWILARLAQA